MIAVVVSAAAFIVVASVLVAVMTRRGRTRVPFDQLSREDQVAVMENRRGDAARLGAHDSAKTESGINDKRFTWGPP